MPVYQYACTACGEQLEVRQSFTDDALTVCPICEGRLRKVLSAVGVVFKGSGFYRTDSREAPAKVPASAAATSTDGSAGSSGDAGTAAASSPSGSKTSDSGGSSGSSDSGGSSKTSKPSCSGGSSGSAGSSGSSKATAAG